MSTPSFISRNAIDFKIRNMVLSSRPNIEIAFNGAVGRHGSYITSFSTLDKIEGAVSVNAKNDTRFDDLEISFTGITKTYVEKLSSTAAASGRTEAKHRFLKLVQPLSAEDLPQPRILEAGKTYTFPFTFVVPPRMLPRSCDHNVANDQIREAHLQLPPSLGDPELSGFGGTLLDDLAPEMAKVSYAVQVQLSRENNFGEDVLVAEKSRKVRIKPAFEELPPLRLENCQEYNNRAEKSVRKGLFKGKVGRLIVEAEQPRSFRLPAPTQHKPDAAAAEVTTMAKIRLRFDPLDANSQPPKLSSLASKIKVSTFYASLARKDFPNKAATIFDLSQGVHSEALTLSSRCVAAVEWTQHSPRSSSYSSATRRDSELSWSANSSTTSIAGAPNTPAPSSKANSSLPYYTAQILVPLTLPHTKHLVPTFHSCLVSRQYALSLHLSANSGTNLSLRLPVQISAEESASGEEQRRLSEQQANAEWEAHEAWRPRSVAPMSPELVGGSATGFGLAGAPPGYDFLQESSVDMGVQRQAPLSVF